jgi:cytochrome c biogenesis protein CcmG, thiol:disulfide interchange protein DsbE
MMVHALTILAGLVATSAEPMNDGRITREGDAEHRLAMDATELKAFDTGLLTALTEWKNGPALSSETLDGRVVAIVFWNNDQAASVRAVVPTLKRLEMSYGRDGFVALAVHSAQAWDGATERIESGLITTLAALDADGAFADALGADDVPDVFVIDRAGQMRFADIDQRQLPAAVRGLVRETREEALAAGERREVDAAAAELKAEKEAKRKLAQSQPVESDEAEKLPPKPGDDAYAEARWPATNKAKQLYAKNVQGKPLPVPFGKSEKWLSKKVPTDGRVVVLDFWATWCGPCIKASPKLDALQKKLGDDVRVIGVSGQARGSRFPEDEKSIRAFMKKHKVAYSHVNDMSQAVYRSLAIRGIPHVIVMSSDGVVRWQGNPLEGNFSRIVEQVVDSDPWVKARRESE